MYPDFLTCGKCADEYTLSRIDDFIVHKTSCLPSDYSRNADVLARGAAVLPQPVLTCYMCGREFHTARGLLQHVQSLHHMDVAAGRERAPLSTLQPQLTTTTTTPSSSSTSLFTTTTPSAASFGDHENAEENNGAGNRMAFSDVSDCPFFQKPSPTTGNNNNDDNENNQHHHLYTPATPADPHPSWENPSPPLYIKAELPVACARIAASEGTTVCCNGFECKVTVTPSLPPPPPPPPAPKKCCSAVVPKKREQHMQDHDTHREAHRDTHRGAHCNTDHDSHHDDPHDTHRDTQHNAGHDTDQDAHQDTPHDTDHMEENALRTLASLRGRFLLGQQKSSKSRSVQKKGKDVTCESPSPSSSSSSSSFLWKSKAKDTSCRSSSSSASSSSRRKGKAKCVARCQREKCVRSKKTGDSREEDREGGSRSKESEEGEEEWEGEEKEESWSCEEESRSQPGQRPLHKKQKIEVYSVERNKITDRKAIITNSSVTLTLEPTERPQTKRTTTPGDRGSPPTEDKSPRHSTTTIPAPAAHSNNHSNKHNNNNPGLPGWDASRESAQILAELMFHMVQTPEPHPTPVSMAMPAAVPGGQTDQQGSAVSQAPLVPPMPGVPAIQQGSAVSQTPLAPPMPGIQIIQRGSAVSQASLAPPRPGVPMVQQGSAVSQAPQAPPTTLAQPSFMVSPAMATIPWTPSAQGLGLPDAGLLFSPDTQHGELSASFPAADVPSSVIPASSGSGGGSKAAANFSPADSVPSSSFPSSSSSNVPLVISASSENCNRKAPTMQFSPTLSGASFLSADVPPPATLASFLDSIGQGGGSSSSNSAVTSSSPPVLPPPLVKEEGGTGVGGRRVVLGAAAAAERREEEGVGGKKRRYPTSRPYKCEQCEQAFNQPVHLKKHMSKHTGVKPFKCEQCEYSTVERSHLKAHNRIHTGEKPFQCGFCSYATAQNSTLRVHLRRHHGNQQQQAARAPSTAGVPVSLGEQRL